MVRGRQKSSKYFLNLQTKHASTNTVKCLQKEDDTLTNSDAEILSEQHNFYSKLYAANMMTEDCETYLSDAYIRELSEKVKVLLEGEIAEAECEDAVRKNEVKQKPRGRRIINRILWSILARH